MDTTKIILETERQRAGLEENVSKLRKSLIHWQTWEAEYEGLREEILALKKLPNGVTRQELGSVCADFAGSLLDEKEIKTLVVDGYGQVRKNQQIIALLGRRIDYVGHNVRAAATQLDQAEAELNKLQGSSCSTFRDEETLPLTGIVENLDEDGNVISSTTVRPGDTAPELLEILGKVEAHVDSSQNLEMTNSSPNQFVNEDLTSVPPRHEPGPSIQEQTLQPHEMCKNLDLSVMEPNTSTSILPQYTRKKSVSFAEGTKLDDAESAGSYVKSFRKGHLKALSGAESNMLNAEKKANKAERIAPIIPEDKTEVHASSASPSNGIEPAESITRSDQEEMHPSSQSRDMLSAKNVNEMSTAFLQNQSLAKDDIIVSPIVPEDDSPKEAALRRDMLQFNMREVGAVVAEIDLDESGSQTSFASDEDDEQYTTSPEDEEDAFGRTTRRVLSNDYLTEMQALEQKLKAKAIVNVGPNFSEKEQAKKKPDSSLKPLHKGFSSSSDSTGKKEVRFSEEVDISIIPEHEVEVKEIKQPAVLLPRPIRDAILERDVPVNEVITSAVPPQILSQIKSRHAKARYSDDSSIKGTPKSSAIPSDGVRLSEEDRTRRIPEGPLGQTHASVVIERPRANKESDVQGPDELDPALLQQEVAVEYHRMRNRMIQRAGGYLKDEEEDEDEDGSNFDGEGRKISKFKAARLAKMGNQCLNR